MSSPLRIFGRSTVALLAGAGLGALVLGAPALAQAHQPDTEGALKQELYLSCTAQLNAGTLPVHGTAPGSVPTIVVNSATQGTGGLGLTCAQLTWTKFLTAGPTAVAFQGVERTLMGDNQEWDCWHSTASYALYRKRSNGTWAFVGGGGAYGHVVNGVCKYYPDQEHPGDLTHWGTGVVGAPDAGEYRIAFFNWIHSAPDDLHVPYYCNQGSLEGHCNLPQRFTIANSTGVPHIGVFRSGKWWLDMDGDNLWSSRDSSYTFGQSGDKPVVMAPAECTPGTTYADIAVMRNPSTWYLSRNDLVWQSTDRTFTFGTYGRPAEWNGSPVSYQGRTFYVDWNGSLAWDAGDLSFVFGLTGDLPVIARWNSASERMGVFSSGVWKVDLNGNNALDTGESSWRFGSAGEYPVAADFNGDGIDNIATFNNGTWYVDMNGNHQWDGNAGGDATYSFGQAGDIPVVAPKNGWRCRKPYN